MSIEKNSNNTFDECLQYFSSINQAYTKKLVENTTFAQLLCLFLATFVVNEWSLSSLFEFSFSSSLSRGFLTIRATANVFRHAQIERVFFKKAIANITRSSVPQFNTRSITAWRVRIENICRLPIACQASALDNRSSNGHGQYKRDISLYDVATTESDKTTEYYDFDHAMQKRRVRKNRKGQYPSLASDLRPAGAIHYCNCRFHN